MTAFRAAAPVATSPVSSRLSHCGQIPDRDSAGAAGCTWAQGSEGQSMEGQFCRSGPQ